MADKKAIFFKWTLLQINYIFPSAHFSQNSKHYVLVPILQLSDLEKNEKNDVMTSKYFALLKCQNYSYFFFN